VATNKLPDLVETPGIPDIYQQFVHQLLPEFAGDISTAYGDRLMAATDNSVYQVLPAAVLYPRHKDDVQKIMQHLARKEFRTVTLLPRGGGTGTNGQALGHGVVVDLSRYMNQILAKDLSAGWVKVQPGVVLDQLNKALAPDGVFFAPNLSPSSRATLGGMCGTDACGKGSRVYGRTSDHLLSLDLILADGTTMTTAPLSASDLKTCMHQEDRMSTIYALMDAIVTRNEAEINDLYPGMSRFLTGYNLSKLRHEDGGLNLNYLIAGSEGTLALVTELTLRLTPIPAHTGLAVVRYATFDDALRDASRLLTTEPHAIETIDDTILELARGDMIWPKVASFFPATDASKVAAVNLVEFSGADLDAITLQLASIEAASPPGCLGALVTSQAKEIAALWDLRKKGVGLLGKRPGNRRPIPFVEDTAVPPEHLAAYIKEFRALLDQHGLAYGMFGHVDVGCLHVRPALDLKQPQDEVLFRLISDEVKKLVQKYQGIMWAEHGRGYRSEYTEDFFGPKLYQELRAIKGAFDPYNQLNPGKIVAPVTVAESIPAVHEPVLRGQQDRTIHAEAQRNFQAALNCNGNGACFHFDADHVMCPSMKISKNRLHSPKGRASIVREWLRLTSAKGYVPKDRGPVGLEARRGYDFSHEVYDAMAGCLGCKACATQCPINVDIPELKSRFLSSYHQRFRRPFFDYAIGFGEVLHGWLSRWPRAYNSVNNRKVSQWLMARVIGLVSPPSLSAPNLTARLQQQPIPGVWVAGRRLVRTGVSVLQTAQPQPTLAKLNLAENVAVNTNASHARPQVILVQDTMTSLYEADLVMDCLQLMTRLGYEVHLAPWRANGKGLHVKGMRQAFQWIANRNLAGLATMVQKGVPMVGIDPAMTLTYREEYPQMLGKTVNVQLFHEWLADALAAGARPPSPAVAKRFALFSHCGEQTSAAAAQGLWPKIFAAFGHQLTLIPTGCCGMAGAYGHEAKHQKDSQGIYGLSWQPHLDTLGDLEPLATGASCRNQVNRFGGKDVSHPAQALLAAFSG
jgi:FAD/FMN-containing dehydrogenase/Fe-S oxidoreductase